MEDAARIGGSLTAVLASFEERVAILREHVDLRALGPTSFAALERVELQLTALEGEVSTTRGTVHGADLLRGQPSRLPSRSWPNVRPSRRRSR